MDIQRLLDEREIWRVLCRLARAMDARAWAELGDIFTLDATADMGEGPLDRAGIEATYRRYLGSCGPTQHLLGTFTAEVDGDRAESRCYIRDLHMGRGDKSHLFLSSSGEYRDRWVRTATGWRIAHRTKTNDIVQGTFAVFDT